MRAALAGEPLTATGYRRGRALLAARRSAEFTRFDGNLGALAPRLREVGPASPDVVVSPTRLEPWARCPHAYFMRYVLGIEPVERPEDIIQLRPIDRGSIVHEVLDRFVAEGGTTDARERLHEIADEVCDEFAERGLTGRRLLWERERRVIHAELDAFFDADDGYRDEYGLRTVATEHRFGPIEVTLPDRATVRVRGAIDRVDAAADGRLVVIDYKTSKPYGFDEEDPLEGGTRLQLPVYALAAARSPARRPTRPSRRTTGSSAAARTRRSGYAVDAATSERFDATLQAIVDGIEGGLLPGPAGRTRAPVLRRLRVLRSRRPRHRRPLARVGAARCDAPELAAYVALTGAIE